MALVFKTVDSATNSPMALSLDKVGYPYTDKLSAKYEDLVLGVSRNSGGHLSIDLPGFLLDEYYPNSSSKLTTGSKLAILSNSGSKITLRETITTEDYEQQKIKEDYRDYTVKSLYSKAEEIEEELE